MAMAKNNVLARSRRAKVETLMRAGKLLEARDLCGTLVRTQRQDADSWVLLAVIHRRLGSYADSETSARTALGIRPRLATAHVALGAALQCQGRLEEAVTRYRESIAIDPDLTEGHYLLGNALREQGLLDGAVASYRRACALQPDFVAALSNLGAVLTAQGETVEAARWLNRALSLAPDAPQVLCNVGVILERDGRFEEARGRLRQALAIQPDFVDALSALAEIEEKESHLDDAKVITERGLVLAPDNTALITVAAKIARSEGRHQDAIDLLERLLAQPHDPILDGEAHLSLGALYDRVGDADRAFQSFTEGNRLSAQKLPADYDHHAYQRELDRAENCLTPALATAWSGRDDPLRDDSPIFLMGFARSGTTLLDQILDSHPRLQTLSEPPTVNAMKETFWALVKDRPDPLTNLDESEIAKLRQVYFDTAARFAKIDPRRRLVDKMPLNTALAHLIWRVFPHSKFILAIRHPCDVCLSCFMQSFGINNAMTVFHSFPDTMELYSRIMGLWRRYVTTLPIDYHRIRYEDLVADFAGEARRLIEYLGVEWDDAVLSYSEHAKTRKINTPSYHQVRQPIYQHARYRWKRYARYFEPYLPALAPYIDYFGYCEP
ncbi:MAG: tetratricopeptide repeat protein [Gammaproteobacteria bacterium]|nr:tetratricopeptide repeat protein [Gammaproteobacteria bacterium]